MRNPRPQQSLRVPEGRLALADRLAEVCRLLLALRRLAIRIEPVLRPVVDDAAHDARRPDSPAQLVPSRVHIVALVRPPPDGRVRRSVKDDSEAVERDARAEQ
jgi:hypothetical protein